MPLARPRPRPVSPLLAALTTMVLGLAATTFVGTVLAAPGQAVPGCDLYASPSGNDASDGTTPATALASPFTLLNRLAAGQDGCLEDGSNFVLGGGAAITATGGT